MNPPCIDDMGSVSILERFLNQPVVMCPDQNQSEYIDPTTISITSNYARNQSLQDRRNGEALKPLLVDTDIVQGSEYLNMSSKKSRMRNNSSSVRTEYSNLPSLSEIPNLHVSNPEYQNNFSSFGSVRPKIRV